MNETLAYILSKFDIRPDAQLPVEIQALDRDGLASLFGELGFKRGAEIGVEQGKYSEVLLKSNPGLKLYCVDAWARYKGYRDHVNQDKLDGFLRATEDRLKPYDGVICRGYSQDVVKRFKRQSLDFVYIDANHLLPYVIQDIWQWSERVRPGGIVSGHDYTDYPVQSYRCHVVDAVKAWTACYRISPWFVIGEAYTVREDGKKMRRNRSWFWVVPE
jgi:hypothetical protein